MIRKTLIALAATVTVGAAALAPTAASAAHFGFGHGWGHGYGWGRGGLVVLTPTVTTDCIQYVRVGYRTWRRVNVCD